MSAFVVDEGHIDYLISAARALRGPYMTLPFDPWTHQDILGRVMLTENVRSVLARYGDSVDAEESRGYSDMIEGYRFQPVSMSPSVDVATIAQIINACDCLEYQSCETSDWDKTDACMIVARIRSAAIQRLPGMSDARWSIERERTAHA